MVSGSTAAIVYGEPRLTNDVDLIVVLNRDHISRLHEVFSPEDFYCPPQEEILLEAAREERGHFNIIHHATGFKADVYLAGRDPLHAWAFQGTRRVEIDGVSLVVAPPEYVIIRKLEYFREGGSEKHLRDIRTILDSSSELIRRSELEQRIAALGLQDVWKKAQSWHEKP